MSGFTLAVLDMAGTTIHDHGMVEQSVRAVVQQVAPQALDDGFAALLHASRGGSKLDMFTRILGDPAAAAEAHKLFEQRLIDAIHQGVPKPIAGATETMDLLREMGLHVVLATGFSKPVREALLDHFQWNERIDLALGPEESGRGRPAPDVVLTAVLKLRVDSMSSVVVVGDTKNDLRCGANAGAGLICGVLTGAHTREDLAQERHDALLNSIVELPAAVLRQLATAS